MSSCDSHRLDEGFVLEMYIQPLTDEDVQLVLKAWEPFRERIDAALDYYWDREEELSWRDYRNAAFDYLPDPLTEVP